MKDLIRIKSMLSTETETHLNQQIKKEAFASAIYLSMAGWCDRNGYEGAADHFYKQSDEERGHQLKLFKFLSDMGGTAVSPEVTGIKQEFGSFREVFEEALEHEITVTQSFKNIMAHCHKEGDYATAEYLNWFLKEQREEEYVARRILELFDVIGESGTGHWDIDRQIHKIEYHEA
ncbi:ferritin [Anseongella ginsenosidimutans]|uniref:Ferritin n=1 Tax=Anseongella ginsenosidimutans TaxID=496056 RepID=A0A4R3KNV6_9SPHI|nr:ferritin [Anseongella ginsenosidimutans]QEC53878.1 ferritin [Anseongella ginsenosidimutans]TCS86260.1 ferritin [Anseongella ginsenosidimutans]